jgi:hypothetical protein
MDQRLDTTMGPRPNEVNRGITTQENNGQQDVMQVTALMATDIGKGVALGLQSLVPLRQDTISQKGGVTQMERDTPAMTLPRLWDLQE